MTGSCEAILITFCHVNGTDVNSPIIHHHDWTCEPLDVQWVTGYGEGEVARVAHSTNVFIIYINYLIISKSGFFGFSNCLTEEWPESSRAGEKMRPCDRQEGYVVRELMDIKGSNSRFFNITLCFVFCSFLISWMQIMPHTYQAAAMNIWIYIFNQTPS